MHGVLVKIAVAAFMSWGFAVAYAQPSLTQLKTELVSAWLVTVDGEERTRTLKITGVEQKDSAIFPLEAIYGWTDGNQTPVRAEISQTGQERMLLLTTQPGSKIAATQKPDGNFIGTFTSTSGQTKGLKIERLSESELTKIKSQLNAAVPAIDIPAASVPASCAAFIGGWTGAWPGYDPNWLWVVAIDNECTAKYSWRPRSRNFRSAKIEKGILSFPCSTSGGTCFFEHHGDELWGRYSGSDGTNTSVFKKVH
ncbi:MAG: hypothetical protein KJZ92_10870 [Rhodocyclaceae bacterium]|jgi:hypothetical protein|nr:hypothetical protein [Rhodocyclaceae bacterium]